MQKDTRKFLKEFRQYILANNEASDEIWTIVTALRGPDGEEDHFKYAYTNVIRYKVLKPDKNQMKQIKFFINPDNTEAQHIRRNFSFNVIAGMTNHFLRHVEHACELLGVKLS